MGRLMIRQHKPQLLRKIEEPKRNKRRGADKQNHTSTKPKHRRQIERTRVKRQETKHNTEEKKRKN